MKLLWRSLWLLAVIGLVLWLWSVFFPSPEKVIRKQLAGVARTASFGGNEGPLARAGNIAELGGYFSADVEMILEVPDRGPLALTGRDEITRAAAGARSSYSALEVEFHDVSVKLAQDKQTATADVAVTGRTPGDRDFFVQEMKFVLRKIKGHWLIIRVESVKTLSHIQAGRIGRV